MAKEYTPEELDAMEAGETGGFTPEQLDAMEAEPQDPRDVETEGFPKPTKINISKTDPRPLSALEKLEGGLDQMRQGVPFSAAAEDLGHSFAAAMPSPGNRTYEEKKEQLKRDLEEKRARYQAQTPEGVANIEQLYGAMATPGFPAWKAGGGLIKRGAVGLGNIAARTGYNVGLSGADAYTRGQDPSEAAANAAQISGIFEGAGLVAKGIGGAAKRAGPFLAGVSQETRGKYLGRRDQINAEDPGAMRQDMIATSDKARGEYESTRAAQTEAKRQLGEAKTDMSSALSKDRPPEDLADDIQASVKKMRAETKAGSDNAFDILNQSDTNIPMRPLKGELTRRFNDLKVFGKQALGSESQTLRKIIVFLKNTDQEARPEEVKRFVQMLDGMAEDIYAQSGQRTPGQRSLLDYRRFVNSYLMEIPGYAKAMEPVAEKTRAVRAFEDAIGDRDQTSRALRSLHNPDNKTKREIIQEIGRLSGKDHLSELGGYEQSVAARNPGDKRALSQDLPETWDYDAARQRASEAKDKYRPVRSVNQDSAEGLLNSYNTPGSAAAKEKMAALGQLNPQANFPQRADDLSVQRALQGQGRPGLPYVPLSPQGAIIATVRKFLNPQGYKAVSDFLSRNQPVMRSFQEAVRRGPQAASIWMTLHSSRDPEFSEFIQQPSQEIGQANQ